MSLILAIDPDRVPTEQLAMLLQRRRLAADVVWAGSAKEGLTALNDRVPDLMLTATLLSSADNAVLDRYLRQLGPDAAKVQTLRIPVMGMPGPKPAPANRGMFARLLGERAEGQAPESPCDPELFATEIAEYLAHADPALQSDASPDGENGSLAEAFGGGGKPDTTYVAEEVRLTPDTTYVAVPTVQVCVPDPPLQPFSGTAAEATIQEMVAPHVEIPVVVVRTPVQTTPAPSRSPRPVRTGRKTRRRPQPPTRSDALFDPNECRFSALLATLEEATSETAPRVSAIENI